MFRTLGTTARGRAVLLAIAIAFTGLALGYAGLLIAIGAMLLLGLLLPIYSGWKRPRHLALVGLVLILLVSPVAAAVSTEMYRTPSPVVSSVNTAPSGHDNATLQNATVNPFLGGGSTNFSFVVDVFPQYHPPNVTNLRVFLFVSSCPDATGNQTPPGCSAGFPYFSQIQHVNHSAVGPIHLEFHQKLPTPDVWWWTMYANFTLSNGSALYAFVETPAGYATVQGPVTGSWFDTFGIIIVQLYLLVALYLGIPFYVGLLAYTWFKSREARRKALKAGPLDTESSSPGPAKGAAPSTTASTAPVELRCPNCQAVVYPSETKCWKCGKPLPNSATPAAAPLPSSGTPPSS